MLIKNKLCIVTATLLLAACGGSSSIYNWGKGEYSNAVYEYLNQEGDPQAQLSQLETLASQSNGKKVAPGLYAQIGLLYNQIGNQEKALVAFNKEAELYPESKQYIQFLINKGNKKPIGAETKAPKVEKKNKKGAKK